MAAKNKPVTIGSVLSTEDVSAYFEDNPVLVTTAQTAFPLVENEETKWKTIQNETTPQNEAADPMSLNSSIPVSGREGFKSVLGEMTTFGKGYEWNADEIEKFKRLKANFAKLQNAAAATQLLDFYGGDLAKIQKAMLAQMAYMDWALISNACSYSFLKANSPYMQGLTAMTYEVDAWQKDEVSTSWDDVNALILDDIRDVVEAGDDNGKTYLVIRINKKWFGYVRSNAQIKAQTISLVGSLVGADNNPNLAAINTMLGEYFDQDIRFEVINEKVTRGSLDGVKTTNNPFQNGVAVFSQEIALGHFEWNKIPIIDATKEVYSNFFLVGNFTQIDPSYAKIYGKSRAFPVVDTYADNFYLRVNGTPWE